jgi:hypothetical protein
LYEAGPGARVLFYRTQKSTERPNACFVAVAEVESVLREESGRYRAALSNYRRFESVVSSESTPIEGWNRQHSIVEIELGTFDAIVGMGFDGDVDEGRRPPDLQSDAVAVSDLLTLPEPAEDTERLPLLPGAESGVADLRRSFGTGRDRSRDRLAESRAIHVVKRMLGLAGWELVQDCQAAGIGYDLLFENGNRVLHVEVKGIIGSNLAFNMTGREWKRVFDDPAYVVIAVRNVLDSNRLVPELLTRDRLANGTPRLTQLRLTVGADDDAGD